MTLNDFRAWLQGYSASFTGGLPNEAQWAEVTRRFALVSPLGALPIPGRDPLGLPLVPSIWPPSPGRPAGPAATCGGVITQGVIRATSTN